MTVRIGLPFGDFDNQKQRLIFQSIRFPMRQNTAINVFPVTRRQLFSTPFGQGKILFPIFASQVMLDDKIHAGIIKCSDKTTVVMTGINPYQEPLHAQPDFSGGFKTTFDKFNRSFCTVLAAGA
ncbi:hypothetical protein SDC9_106639 [bioreactor metagenome]|uniref:Uncharacterized protein n=1 Tax=bioreactor metagenome TaxID=1076179 RepID=A0A645B9I5_9ZZZZ